MSAPERALNALADVICRAQAEGRMTPMGIVHVVDAAGMLQSPETAAEQARVREERDRYRIAWRMARTRARSVGGAADRYATWARESQEAMQDMLFSVIGAQLDLKAAQKESAELRVRVAELEAERHSTNGALADVTVACRTAEAAADRWRRFLAPVDDCPGCGLIDPDGVHDGTCEVAADEGLPPFAAALGELTVFRASHDSIVLGLYTSRGAARAHCEAYVRREIPGAVLDWIEDEEDGVSELAAAFGKDERSTGYVVTPLTVAAAYDEEADE